MSSLSKNKKELRGYLALAITCVVWGTTWVASKIGVQEIPATQMASLRQLLGGLSFVLFFMLVKKYPLPTLKEFKWILVMSVLMFVFANGLSTWSLKYIPTGLSALIGALYPLSVVIIEKLFFKTMKLNLLTFIGLFLGLTGVGIVFYESAFDNLSADFVIGLALSVVAMLSWSLGTIFISRNSSPLNAYYSTGWQMLISAGILFLVSQAAHDTVPLNAISLRGWMAILYLVLFGSIIAFIAFIYSMKVLPTAISSLYAYINPLITMIVASVLVREKLTIYILWGGMVTLIGVYLVNLSIKRNPKIEVESEI